MDAGKKDIIAGATLITLCAFGLYAIYTNYFASEEQRKLALDARKYQKFRLVKKINVSHNTRKFRFALQNKATELGLPCGKHMSLRFFEKNAETGEMDEIRRPYTPITSNREKGYFDLMIKVYSDGKMSSYLDSLVVNKDTIEARGPMGNIEYRSPGFIHVKQKKVLNKYKASKIGMICGGTGITPMLQLVDEIVANGDPSQVSMIFGNVSIDDILMKPELDKVRAENDNVHIKFTVDKGPTDGRQWDEEVGYVTPDMIKSTLFPPADDVVVCLCGPPIMVKICKSNLLKLGYDEAKVLSF